MKTQKNQPFKVTEVELSYKSRIKPNDRFQVSDASEVYYLFKHLLKNRIEHHEEVHVVLLNQALKILGISQVSKGGISESTVDARIIFQLAILSNATKIILVHNHPSGNINPSQQDDDITSKINRISIILGIELIDHVIIAKEGYYSYAIEGRTGIISPSLTSYSSPFLDLDEIKSSIN